MQIQSVNLNSIVFNSIKKNYLLITCIVITFLGFISYNIIFPRLFTKMLEIENITKRDIMYTSIPFIIGQVLFCLSDKLYSHGIHQFDKNIVNNMLQNILFCYMNSYDERDSIAIYSSILKLLELKHFIHIFLEYIIPVIVMTIGTFITLFIKDAKLGIFLLVIISLFLIIIVKHINRHLNRHPQEFEYKKELNDIIFNIDKILLNNNIKNEMEHFKNYEDNHVSLKIKKEKLNVEVKCLIALMSVIILVVIGSKIIELYNNKRIDKGELAYYFYLIIVLLQYYDSLSIELHNFLTYLSEYKELNAYFGDINCGVSDVKPDINISNGNIIFDNVNIYYGDKPVFNSLNFEIKGGTKVGIYGRNGIGKSTIFKVLLGLLPYKGSITIDGVELSDVNISSFRTNIGFVNQHSMLFNRSIYENIQYGNKKSKTYIDDFMTKNNLQDFVKGLGKDGLETIISKNGESLSGGQRCILNILKVILDDKKILLIDEPSNNLDNDMNVFLHSILKNLKDKTVIVITHDSNLDDIFDNKIILR